MLFTTWIATKSNKYYNYVVFCNMDSHKDQKYYIYCAFFNLVLGVSRRSPGDLSGEEISSGKLACQHISQEQLFFSKIYSWCTPLVRYIFSLITPSQTANTIIIIVIFAIWIATESKKYYNYCAFCQLDSHEEQQVL